MTNEIDIRRRRATLPGAKPVAMQCGGHDDRIVLARLRLERRWLLRDTDTAGLAPDHPPGASALRG
jgi:hypothetical protein